MLLHYLGKLEIKFSADIQQIWKKMHTHCILSTLMNTCLPRYLTYSPVDLRCSLSSWFKTKLLTVSTFSSVRALHDLPLPGRLSTVPVSRNFFSSFLTPCFVHLFSGNSSVNCLLCTPSNAEKLIFNFPSHCSSMPKVRMVVSYGFYSKFHTLSSSAKFLKIDWDLTLIDWAGFNVPLNTLCHIGDRFLRVKWPNQQC